METAANEKQGKAKCRHRYVWLMAVVACLILIFAPLIVSLIRNQRQKAFIASLEARGVGIDWEEETYPNLIETFFQRWDTNPPRLQVITNLIAENIDFTDKELRSIGDLRRASYINLNGTGITNEGLAMLANSSELAEMDLSRTKISGTGLKSLSKLSQLLHLDLSHTRISDNDLIHLREMHKLESICLHGTNVTIEGLKQLGRNPDMTLLTVGTSQDLSDDDLETLSSFPELRDLYLADLPITDEVIQRLIQSKQIRRLMIFEKDLRLSEDVLRELMEGKKDLIVEIGAEEELKDWIANNLSAGF